MPGIEYVGFQELEESISLQALCKATKEIMITHRSREKIHESSTGIAMTSRGLETRFDGVSRTTASDEIVGTSFRALLDIPLHWLACVSPSDVMNIYIYIYIYMYIYVYICVYICIYI
jgi:hypothetical protein